MTGRVVRVGTRASALALRQTDEVIDLLRKAHPETEFEIVPISPEGDRRKSAPLTSLVRGTFVKGLEECLLRGEIDLAVHSSKDMPTTLPDGLTIAAFPKRRDARDVIVNVWSCRFNEIPAGARLGTSSPRRSGQILAARPDLRMVPIRGNVDTRLTKVGSDGIDGVVLAAAGLERLGRSDVRTDILEPEVCVPDAGQGALAVEARSEDRRLLEMMSAVNDRRTWSAVTAERAFVEATGGGCRVPVAAYAVVSGDCLDVMTMACLPDGSDIYRGTFIGPASDPHAVGRGAAEALMATGADSIMYGDHRG